MLLPIFTSLLLLLSSTSVTAMTAREFDAFINYTFQVQAAVKAVQIEQAFESLRASKPASVAPLKSLVVLSASGGNTGSNNVIYNCVVPGTFAMT